MDDYLINKIITILKLKFRLKFCNPVRTDSKENNRTRSKKIMNLFSKSPEEAV